MTPLRDSRHRRRRRHHEAKFEMLPDSRRDGLAERLHDSFAVGRMDIGEGQGSGKIPVTEQARIGRTVVNSASFDVENCHETFEVLGDQAEELFLLAQGVFHLPTFGDIPVGAGDPYRLSLFVSQDQSARDYVQIVAVLVAQAEFATS
jgi:hypothetical protein